MEDVESVAGFMAGHLLHLLGYEFADAAEFDLPFFGVHLMFGHELAVFEFSTLSDHDQDAAMAGGVEMVDVVGHVFHGEFDLRKQHDVRATADSSVESDPAGVTTHDFYDHDALVTVSRGVKTIQRVDDGGDCGVETKSHRGGLKIVIDGLRDAHGRHAFVAELQPSGQRPVSTDDDESVNAKVFDRRFGLIHDFSRDQRDVVHADLGREVTFVGGAEDGAAEL